MTSHSSGNCSPKHVSVATARSDQPKQLVRVAGHYLRKNGTTQICSRIIASRSPRCAGSSLVVRSYEPGPHVIVHHANGVAWTSDMVQVYGLVSGMTLHTALCA
jgi:riboflavin biosynthesis pyrimidine reductase